jgi:hypothetical protein
LFEQPGIREADDLCDQVALDLQDHQAVRPVLAVVAAGVGGECRLPVGRGRQQADLVEPPALRHGTEEVTDRPRARDPHPLWGHCHQRVLAQQCNEALDVDRVPGRHEPFYERTLAHARCSDVSPSPFHPHARTLEGAGHRSDRVVERLGGLFR